MELEFKQFNGDQELDKQRVLFTECFPETIGASISTKTHYNWKFHSTYKTFEYGAYSDNDIIGYYAAIPYKYKYFDKNITAAMVCDVMTGVKARGKGVFTKLGYYSNQKFKEGGLDFSSGFPIRPEVIPGHLKVGWEILFDLPLYTRFIKFNSFLKNKKKSLFIPLFNTSAFFYGFLLNIFTKKNKEITVHNYSSIKDIDLDDGFFSLLKEKQDQIPISLIKDKEFIMWRLNAPKTQYNISVVKHNEKLVGYAISRFITKEGVPSIGILDISLLDGFYHLSRYLLKEIDRFAKKENAEFIFIMMSSYWFKNYELWKSGYLKSTYKFKYIFKRLNLPKDNVNLNDPMNWNLMWIDSDDL